MAKRRKLTWYLAAFALGLLVLWFLTECPRFTAERAFHRVERREARKESRYLGSYHLLDVYTNGQGARSGKHRCHLAVGRAGDALYYTEVQQLDFRWYSDEELLTLPLEGAVTAEFQPWCCEWRPMVMVYSQLDYAHGVVMVTIGEEVFDQRFTPGEQGFSVVVLESLYRHELEEQVSLRQYDLRPIGYDESRKTHDVTLEVVLYDRSNAPVASVVKEYPRYQAP